MTRADLIDAVSNRLGMPRIESEIVVVAIFESLMRSLRAGNKVELRGFGTFGVRQHRARMGRNPKTGVQIKVPAKTVAYFRPGKELKGLVNNSAASPTKTEG